MLLGVTEDASWRRVQRARHSALKAFQVQTGRGNAYAVFKEDCRACRVKTWDRAREPDLGALKATTSSTAPSGVLNDSAYSRMVSSSVARTTLWPLPRWLAPTGPCSAGSTRTMGAVGGPQGHPLGWPPRSSEPMSPRAPQSQLAVVARKLLAPKGSQQSEGLCKQWYATGTNTRGC